MKIEENITTNENSNNINKIKKSPKVIIGVIVILIIVALILGLLFGKKANGTGRSGFNSNLKAHEISTLKEYSGNTPDFEFTISGAFKSTITNKDLEKMDIKIYEFDANMDNGWDVVKTHYTGIKLKDLLDETKISESKSYEIKFEGQNRTSITYDMDKLTENMFIVFYKDGKKISEEQSLMLINVDKKLSYSLDELVNIYVPHNIDATTN